MEEKAFFTAKEREQLFALYKRLLQLSGDTLQKGDCHKLKIHLIKAVEYNQMGSGCSAIKFPNGQMEAPYLSLPDNGMSH